MIEFAPPSGVLARYIDEYVLPTEKTTTWTAQYGHVSDLDNFIGCMDYGAGKNYGTDPNTGELRLKGQVMVLVRHSDQHEAYRMMSLILNRFAAMGPGDLILVEFPGKGTVHLHAVAHKSGPLSLGKDEKDRFTFTLNVIPTMTDFK